MKRNIHNLIFGVLCLVMLGYGSAYAGTFGDFTYMILGDNTIEITDYPTTVGGDVVIPDTINGTNVTSIGESAFLLCDRLTRIIIPDSVTNIGDFAFDGCFGLTNTVIGTSVTNIGHYAFRQCLYLTSVAIPDSVISIGDRAFSYCSGLTSITIPDNVTNIGYSVFAFCSKLSSIDVGLNNAYYSVLDGVLFNKTRTSIISCPAGKLGEYIIPNGVTNIYAGAFESSALTSIILPDSLSSIGYRAFAFCSGLSSLSLPDSALSIGDEAFIASGLISITLPNGVASVGVRTFASCSGLTSITLPNSVTTIGDDAFKASGLLSIILPNGVTRLGSDAFTFCSGLTSIKIPASVNRIGFRTFGFNPLMKAIVFNGNAPILFSWFDTFQESPQVKVYYRSSASGFGSTFGDRPTALIPEFTNMTTTASNMVMNTLGTDGEVYVLQSCTNLAQGAWTSLETNTVSGGGVEFNLPTQGNDRFYRVVIEL